MYDHQKLISRREKIISLIAPQCKPQITQSKLLMGANEGDGLSNVLLSLCGPCWHILFPVPPSQCTTGSGAGPGTGTGWWHTDWKPALLEVYPRITCPQQVAHDF